MKQGTHLESVLGQCTDWLFRYALRIWSTVGVDQANDGFVDSIDLSGVPNAESKRCRVQARQIYSFIQAGRLGWQGPWREIVDRGADFLIKYYIRGDGQFCFSVHHDGTPHDDSILNYELSFVLFALAHLFEVTGSHDYEKIALGILDHLERDCGHPLGGFYESPDRRPPLLANPHMHFFEATLAWRRASANARWVAASDTVGRLCLTRMIEPISGTLCEHFDAHWRPSAVKLRRSIEPGHQFEWAWLLWEWKSLSGVPVERHARALYDFGVRCGFSSTTNCIVNEVTPSGQVTDGRSRLWAQAEWMRAALAFAKNAPDDERTIFESHAQQAWAALRRYLDYPIRGLWYDYLDNNILLQEPARATSLYHIVGAISALIAYCNSAYPIRSEV